MYFPIYKYADIFDKTQYCIYTTHKTNSRKIIYNNKQYIVCYYKKLKKKYYISFRYINVACPLNGLVYEKN